MIVIYALCAVLVVLAFMAAYADITIRKESRLSRGEDGLPEEWTGYVPVAPISRKSPPRNP